MFKSLFVFLFSLSLCFTIYGQDLSSEFFSLIKKRIPNASFKKLKTQDHFKEVYQINLVQPIDHGDPTAGSFEQRIFLSHIDRKKPVVFVTEGYNARQTTYELSKMLDANQIIVEYRFFGGSKPNMIDWKYMTNDQAMEDLHRIRKIFKKVYRKKWVSTGISKGGTTTLIYKSKYPKDVCVAVPYVAPLAFAQEDKRTDKHILTMGTEACRQKLTDFQRLALTKREEMLAILDTFTTNHNYTYSIGQEAVLEYAVLEFTFSFWQWGANCDEIPGKDASAAEIFKYINDVVGWSFYNDATYRFFEPAFYQFVKELGYYGFLKDHLSDLLVTVKEPNNLIFAPKNTDLTFEPYLKPVNDYLMKKGNKILYIYGEVDTWTACGVVPSPNTDALRMVKKGGSHTTRIASFSKEEQAKIYAQLEKWLKLKVTPLEN